MGSVCQSVTMGGVRVDADETCMNVSIRVCVCVCGRGHRGSN